MNVIEKIQEKWYNWRQYRNNIKLYKDFLKEDSKYNNGTIILFLMFKLARTADHYNSEDLEYYDGWASDKKDIERALYLTKWIYGHDNGVYVIGSLDEIVEELFDILKNYKNWWD